MNKKRLLIVKVLLLTSVLAIQAQNKNIYMDFRNQKITDIIYSIAEVCGESVLIDETVTGNTTFRFEDKDFDSAIKRFADYCQLYIEKNNDAYIVSKVYINSTLSGKLTITTENVQIEPFLNKLSRYTNRTILYDSIPNTNITIRTSEASLEDILNLTIVKLPGYGLERIADGFYITRSAGNNTRRNVDIFTVSNENDMFSCNIQNATFTNVIDTIFKKAGKEYSLLSKFNIQLENLSYTSKPFEKLLSLILTQCNCDYTVEKDIYYIFEIQKKDIIKKFKNTKIIQLKNISIETVSSLLPNDLNAQGFIKFDKNSNSIILNGSSSEISPIEDFITKIDIPSKDRTYKSFYLDNISTKEVISIIPKSLLISEIILLPSENGFVTQVTEENSERLSDFIKILDNKKQSQSITLKYIKAEELLKSLPPSVSKDNITITNEPTLLFFTGTQKQFDDFKKELEIIDQPRQQIKYQLLVIQRQKTEGLTYGTTVNAGTTNAKDGYSWTGMLSNIFNINFDIISKFGVQFAGTLNAELSEGKSRVLADTTLNGLSGESLSFSNTNTYRYRDIIVDTKGDLYTSTTREISSGITLSINGWVSGDEMVTVKVDAQISKQGSSDSSSNNTVVETTVPPSTSEKKVSTNVRSKNGEPVVIGGLFQQEEDISEKRVPLFGKIPFIGNLFKDKVVTTAESEFIIYLVPLVEKSNITPLNEDENLARLKKKYLEN